MKIIYIAGPMESQCNGNLRQILNWRDKADALSIAIRRMGGVPICVHTMYHAHIGEFDEAENEKLNATLIRRSDAVALLPGWEASPGTLNEKNLATFLGLPMWEAELKFSDGNSVEINLTPTPGTEGGFLEFLSTEVRCP